MSNGGTEGTGFTDEPMPGMPEPPAVPADIGVRRWRKLPVEIEAAQFLIGTPVRSEADASYANGPQLAAWCGGQYFPGSPGKAARIVIETLEGAMTAAPGWWVIKGVAGEFYPCDPGVFEQTYEPAPLPFGENPPTDPCGCGPDEPCEEHAEPPLPDGRFGRVEMPGYRQYTGWVSDGASVGGALAAIVRDWDGRITNEVVLGPGCQFVPLPTPLKRPDAEPRRALPAGARFGMRPCLCGPDEECDDCEGAVPF